MNYLVCTKCNNQYSLDKEIWKCECGGVLDIIFDSTFPQEKIEQRTKNLWRYREAIPIRDNKNIVSFHEGFTPLIDVNFYGSIIKIKHANPIAIPSILIIEYFLYLIKLRMTILK